MSTTLAASSHAQSLAASASSTDSFETAEIQVSVVMPCLNEARTVAACILQARAAQDSRQYRGEIIIADNGSTDGSQSIAEAAGARVIHIPERGYGSALRGGIAAARGVYVVMGDSDCSYDFGEIPHFVDKLREGYDLVMGNRFAGEIKPGAMPWHHRYIGNPVLSGIGRLLFWSECRDFHCGLRALRREMIDSLGLRCKGMEFASEMVIKMTEAQGRIGEIPITLSPDGRDHPPHLRSVRDGMRHLQTMLMLFVNRRFRTLIPLFGVRPARFWSPKPPVGNPAILRRCVTESNPYIVEVRSNQ